MREFVKVDLSEAGTGEVLIDANDDGSGFTTIHLTPEQSAYLRSIRERRDAANDSAERIALLARCKAERAEIKAVQQKRWDARRDELMAKGELKPGETLEQYDTRKAKDGHGRNQTA